MKRKGEKILRPVVPNAGLQMRYRRKLWSLIDEMNASVLYHLKAAYRQNAPEIALDELPASALKRALKKLARQWQKRFDDLAPKLADYFAKAAAQRSDGALRQILKEAGFTVEFTMTRAVQDILRASIEENASLIRSIPSQYFTQVEGIVYRSVTAGRDLAGMTKDLQEQFGVAHRRAAAISLDQNNKITSDITRARRIELSLFDAVWLHSHAGKTPRPTHVAMNGKRFDIRKGMWDSHEKKWVQPGELIRCHCLSKPVLTGMKASAA